MQPSEKRWVKTPIANLVRYVPSGVYFARAKVGGKLIRQSLKTSTISVAKLRLADLLKEQQQQLERNHSVAQGKMSFEDAFNILDARLQSDPNIKASTKKYQKEIIEAVYKSWPELRKMDVRRITKANCLDWRSRFAASYSGTRVNGAISLLRRVLDMAVDSGVRYDNPAKSLPRAKVRHKNLKLPSAKEFQKLVATIENAGGRFSRDCADFVQFLAFGGFRKSEAASVKWQHCDFEKREILIVGDEQTGTKNWTSRRVPMISEMEALLIRIKEKEQISPGDKVMRIQECQKALDSACKNLGISRITHHDLRHLFATRCIESGVDIPTVSRWLGHKDGGALAMKVYGHLRDQHSSEMAKKVSFAPKDDAREKKTRANRKIPVAKEE
ncbi:MAG: tyrosine-type recombinase/integrase [Limisphaerales bacterium]